MRARLSSWARSVLVATIAVGAVAFPSPAHADVPCLEEIIELQPGYEVELCISQDAPQIFFQVYVAGEHVAAGYLIYQPPFNELTVGVVDEETTFVQISAGIATDEVTGDQDLVVCVTLLAGPLGPTEECRSRRLP